MSDPRHDPVCCVVVSILHDWLPSLDGDAQETHVLVVNAMENGKPGNTLHQNPAPSPPPHQGVAVPPSPPNNEYMFCVDNLAAAGAAPEEPGPSCTPSGTKPAAACTSMGLQGVHWHACKGERAMFTELAALVRASDPDILLSWEVQRAGLGYLMDRATALNISLASLLSRTPEVRYKARLPRALFHCHI